MKVSIITATYNRSKTIIRAMKSLKEQNYKNIESVIIDGQSTDDTLEVIIPYLLDDNILLSEPDKGIYDALNKGISLSSGEIIGFLHSDDIFYNKNVISNVVKIFTETSANIVYGDAVFFRNDNIKKIIRYYKSDVLSLKNLSWGRMPAHTAMFIKKDLYDECGLFDVSYKISGDFDFLIRLASAKNLNTQYIPEPLIRMQLGGTSTSNIKNTVLLNQEVIKACKKNNLKTNLFKIISKYPSKIMQFFYKQYQ